MKRYIKSSLGSNLSPIIEVKSVPTDELSKCGVIIKIQNDKDTRTDGEGYYHIFVERHGKLVPESVWKQLKVTIDNATHFPSWGAGVEWVQDNICNKYKLVVDIHNKQNIRVCRLAPDNVNREDTVEFFIHPEAGVYVGQSRLFRMSGDTLEEAIKHIKRCAIEALRPDSDKEVIFDDNIDYDENNPDDLGTLHITWIPNAK